MSLLIYPELLRALTIYLHLRIASLKRLKNGDMSQVDPKLKCYVKCFMVRNGILTDDSTVDIEKALRHLPKNLQDGSRRTLDGCKIIRESLILIFVIIEE